MTQPDRPPWPLVAVLGPTGSGKTEAALRIAEEWPAEVVNCDSLQVYRYLDAGTAKPLAGERRGVPHHMMDVVNPDGDFSAGEYARRARPILVSIAASGRVPLVAGGTGFYFRALLDGLFPGPPRDEALRGELGDREIRRPGLLYRFLKAVDPAAAQRIHPNDTNKLIRAVEVFLLTRRPLTRMFEEGRDRLTGFRTLKLVLDPPREALYEKLDRRARLMFERGLVDEVRGLLERGFSEDCKPFEALGYSQAIQQIRGEISAEQAVALTQRNTRRYAKRQWTWFRQEPDAVAVDGFGAGAACQNRILAMVNDFLGGFPNFFSLF